MDAFVLDDDVVILGELKDLFQKENGAYYINSPLYYYVKTCGDHMVELDAYSRVMGKDLRKIYKENERSYKVCQYNAGHYKVTLDEDFLSCLESYYKDSFFSNRFFKTTFNKEKECLFNGVKFYNRCFFDEQRFVTHYFLSRPDKFQHKDLNRKSDVYLSKDESEFLEMGKEQFFNKVKKYKIIHYVAKEKLKRAVKLRSLLS